MQVIGVRATEADDALGTRPVSGVEVFDELEPFVAADQRVDLIQAQDGDFDSGAAEPVELQWFEGAWGRQFAGGESIDAGPGKRAGILAVDG
jgi:hypothetical protein